ncbi:MAG: hypothetical protein DRJ03_03285 [Chloroflexi bacterium]|nr:MAG: hypothetical protein DRJ03_03285 [Chloroflexota bacterium]
MVQKLVATPPINKATGLPYHRWLVREVLKPLAKEIEKEILPLLQKHKGEFRDGLIADLRSKIGEIKKNFETRGGVVSQLFRLFASEAQSSRRIFLNIANKALGVNLSAALKKEGVDKVLGVRVKENVKLIKSISHDHLDDIADVILSGVGTGIRHEELAKQIIGKMNNPDAKIKKRAKLIAQNETINLLADLNKQRSEALGINRFRWQTAEDERVRGTPGGKYPDAIPSHYALNGQEFSWGEGAKTEVGYIFPGTEINCRCIAINVIDLDDL